MLEDHLRMLFESRGIEDSLHLQTYKELAELALKHISQINLNEYALVVFGKLVDRVSTYLYGDLNQLVHENDRFLHYFHGELISNKSPMWISVEKFEYMNFQLDSILFTVIFFLFLIDGILIYSLMLNDVEERSYEFAMLRCLGFKNSSLVTLLLVQVAFQSIPATIVGFMLAYSFM